MTSGDGIVDERWRIMPEGRDIRLTVRIDDGVETHWSIYGATFESRANADAWLKGRGYEFEGHVDPRPTPPPPPRPTPPPRRRRR